MKAEDRMNGMWDLVNQARVDAKLRAAGALLERPAGGFTINEYGQHFGLSRATAKVQCEQMRDNGTVLEVQVMLATSYGRVQAHRMFVPIGRSGKGDRNAPQLRSRRSRRS